MLALGCYVVSIVSGQYDEQMSNLLPETVANCSSHNSQSSGYKALFEVASKLGMDCQRYEKPYRDLSPNRGVLLVVAPNFPMLAPEVDRIIKWVEEGNNLVYLDYCVYGNGKYLLDKLGMNSLVSSSIDDAVLSGADLPAIPEMSHVSQIVVSSETRLSGGKALLSDSRGALAVQVHRGRGRCLIAVLPSLCANRRITEQSNWGNFQFLLNWLKSCGGTVYFDERVHGYTTAQNVFSYLMSGPFRPILLQIVLIFAFALYSLNQRFGPLRPVHVSRKIASSEYIDGMALTYQKARAYDTALSILFASFRHRLCKALSLPPAEPLEQLAKAWSQSTQLSEAETLSFLQTAERLQSSRTTTEAELLACMKDCDRLYEKSKQSLSVQPGRRLGG